MHDKHHRYPEVCKAWVALKATRDYTGWVEAQFTEQHSCTAGKTPASTRCKQRPYARTARRRVSVKAGQKLSLSFYVSTPPQTCRKPGLTDRTYKTGCFCMGLDTTQLRLFQVSAK